MSVPQFQETLESHTVAFADLDKDGTQDFLLQTSRRDKIPANGCRWKLGASSLVQNEQTSDETGALLPVDFDHDGDLDLFSGQAGVTMYRNNGDDKGNVTFTDVSKQTFVTTDADNVLLPSSAHLLKQCPPILMTTGI